MTTNDYKWLPWLLKWLPTTINDYQDYQWLHTGYVLTTFWLHSDYILTTFWLHSDYILTTFWPHSDYILTTFWLHYDYIMTTFWQHSDLRKACLWTEQNRYEQKNHITHFMNNHCFKDWPLSQSNLFPLESAWFHNKTQFSIHHLRKIIHRRLIQR